MTLAQAQAALHWPGWLEIGEADIAARVSEYGAGHPDCWPCCDWDWMRHLLLTQMNGAVRDFGPVRTDAWRILGTRVDGTLARNHH